MARRVFRFSPTHGEVRHFSLLDGVVGGQMAGGLFALMQMLAAAAGDGSAWLPWRLAASLLLGSGAVSAPASASIVLAGLFVHLMLSAFFGALWAVAARLLWPAMRDNLGSHAALAALYGAGVWLLNVQLIARGMFPWINSYDSPAQVLLHAFAYGLPLGLYVATRVRAVDAAVEQGRHPA
ncbi:MAG TPA: hypothetical protein VK420_11550 [Longimicrobium sp.]|nr:hypothetical protein [Longimicrobium sp.]